jgi:hypothetical protein
LRKTGVQTEENKHRLKLFQPVFISMSGVSKLFEAATPRFINSLCEFIYVFMGVPILLSLLCYWAAKKLGMSMTEIANRVGLTQPAVCIKARRRE